MKHSNKKKNPSVKVKPYEFDIFKQIAVKLTNLYSLELVKAVGFFKCLIARILLFR